MKHLLLGIGLLCHVGCNSAKLPDPVPSSQPSPVPTVSTGPTSTPTPSPSASPDTGGTQPTPSPTIGLRPVLLYTGGGSWAPEIDDIKRQLSSLHIPFYAVTSLKGVEYNRFAAIIMGGGKASVQSQAIGSGELARLRTAVNNGLNYLGHCAGAFLVGDYGSWGLKLVPLVIDYPSFYPNISLGISSHKMKCCGQTSRYVLYYGGPDLDPVGGSILATYANGAASIVQLRVGRGLVVLTGGHPEVSENTKQALGVVDPDGVDSELEIKLIRAVVDGLEVQ